MTSDSSPDEKYPARQVLLADDEIVIRAVVEEEWIDGENRGSPSIFRRPNTSMTRINSLGLESGIAVVKRDVEWSGKPARMLRGAGEISVSLLKIVGRAPVPAPKPGACIYLEVWEEKVKAKDGRPANDHHAEIVAYDDPERTKERSGISLGYSRMLSKALRVHAVDASGTITSVSEPLDWANVDKS